MAKENPSWNPAGAPQTFPGFPLQGNITQRPTQRGSDGASQIPTSQTCGVPSVQTLPPAGKKTRVVNKRNFKLMRALGQCANCRTARHQCNVLHPRTQTEVDEAMRRVHKRRGLSEEEKNAYYDLILDLPII